MFLLVVLLGAGIPGPGDAALITAGALAGDGRVNIVAVLVVAFIAWMIGSLLGYFFGLRSGREVLEHPGRLEKRRRRLLEKGDRGFAKHNFSASATLPAFVSGIFKVRPIVFVLGAITAGVFWIGIYVELSYLFGEEFAKRVGKAGTRLLVAVIVLVAVGLLIRAQVARRRAARFDRAEHGEPA